MPRQNGGAPQRRGVLYAMMLFLLFLILLALAVGGLWLVNRNSDFYSTFRMRIHPRFYLSTALLLVGSSVLYTPFSYGISHFFILASRGEGRFSALFFLFARPWLLAKAIGVSVLKKGLIYLERLAVLLAAALLEVVLFFSFLLFTGEDLFAVRGDPFAAAAEFMLRSPALIALSALLWAGVLFMMLISYLRYILCKYVLLCIPEASTLQALKVGTLAIRGHLWRTLGFYLRYGAVCILSLFGVSGAGKVPFSAYAGRLAEEGWHLYCRRRSLR